MPLSLMPTELSTLIDGIAMHALGGTEAPPSTDTSPPTPILTITSKTITVTRTLLGNQAAYLINTPAPSSIDTPPPLVTEHRLFQSKGDCHGHAHWTQGLGLSRPSWD